MAITHGIQVTPSFQTRFAVNITDGFRFTIVAHDAVNMPTKIFRYKGRPQILVSGNPPQMVANADMVYDFDGVCSPADLEDFPEDQPGPADDPAWCRRDTVDLVLRSRTTAKRCYDSIMMEVGALVDSLDATSALTAEDQLQFGPAPTPTPSPTPAPTPTPTP